MKTSVQILMEHALATIPDSVSARKPLLRALSHVMDTRHPHYKTVLAMLGSLALHESQQAKLGLRLPPPRKTKGNKRKYDGDGQHDGNGGDGK